MCIMTRENSIAVVASLIVHSWGEGVSCGVDFSGLKKKKKVRYILFGEKENLTRRVRFK